MQIAHKNGEGGVIRQAFEEFTDVGDPERPLKARSYLAQALGKRQDFSLASQVFTSARRRCSCSAVMPLICTSLSRFVLPLAMVTEERGISKKSARNSITAWLALPSTGGAVRSSFSASPTVPVMAFLRARG